MFRDTHAAASSWRGYASLQVRKTYFCRGDGERIMDRMINSSQFCPVAKAAEVFGDRWTPIIMRELRFGTRSFGELLAAAPLISRTVLAQRLKQLEQDGVLDIEAKPKGKGHLY